MVCVVDLPRNLPALGFCHPRCRRSNPGLKAKAIEEMWKSSDIRAKILEGISESEQKSRRYI